MSPFGCEPDPATPPYPRTAAAPRHEPERDAALLRRPWPSPSSSANSATSAAKARDQPAVGALLRALDDYLGSLSPQDNHLLSLDELLSPQAFFLVARQQGRAVGCAAFRRMPGEPATDGQAYGEIKRMMVTPQSRGSGIGAALLAALERQLRDEGLGLALLKPAPRWRKP